MSRPAEVVVGVAPAGGAEGAEAGPPPRFTVRVGDVEGPYDLLLHLLARRRLEITELAVSQVTDEFLTYVRGLGDALDLDEATGFLVVAATLVDWKAARLLPGGEAEDDDDLERLSERDLLFSRLLTYRAFSAAAELLGALAAQAPRSWPSAVPLPEDLRDALPDVALPGADALARAAARVLAPRPEPVVATGHLHRPAVDPAVVRADVLDRVRADGGVLFADLVAGADVRDLVARFLAVLQLVRAGALAVEQPEPLGPLTVRPVELPTRGERHAGGSDRRAGGGGGSRTRAGRRRGGAVSDDARPRGGAAAELDADVDLVAAVEALLLVSEAPVRPDELCDALGADAATVEQALREAARRAAEQGRGVVVQVTDGTWRLGTAPALADVVGRHVRDDGPVRLSRAALETLAVIAYRQPVSRARVAAVRGVSADAVVRGLLTRGLVSEVGTDPETGAVLYGTTTLFLERLGLTSTDELPDLAPLLPEAADVSDEAA